MNWIFRSSNCLRFLGLDCFFDNMNNYFGNSGFDIVDRTKKHRPSQKTRAKRTNISNERVTFENAWGVCDEDIYNKLLKESDEQHRFGKPFFNFAMNNSNHQPYTYPNGLTDIPSGSSREGDVKYADSALKKRSTKPSKKQGLHFEELPENQKNS